MSLTIEWELIVKNVGPQVYFFKTQTQGITNHANISSK